MKIRLDFIMAAVFAFAIFIHPEIPSWYTTAELIMAWTWFGFLTLASLIGLFMIRYHEAVTKAIFNKSALAWLAYTSPQFNLKNNMISLVIDSVVLYSAYLQGFTTFFGPMVMILVFYQILRAVHWHMRRTKTA